jgi:flagellar FliL protein
MSDKPQKSNTLKIAIIVLLLLVVVGGSTFAGVYFVGQKASTATTKPANAVEVTEVTYALGEFLVNLLDENGRILKVNVFISYEENEKLTAELETKKPIIRDVVNTSFRSKKATDFGATGVETIKNELIAIINPVLTKGKISHIYFNDIFIQ